MELTDKSETIRVYKYHKFNIHLIQLLTLNRFYCATIKELNDPFDGAINLRSIFLTKLFRGKLDLKLDPIKLFDEFYLSEKIEFRLKKPDGYWTEITRNNYITETLGKSQRFANFLINKLNYRVISFSGKANPEQESLMWGHYTDNCKGVRLTFEFPMNTSVKIEDVIPTQNGILPDVHSPSDLKRGLLSKYEQWSHENEKRILVTPKKNPFLVFEQSHLKEIAFGVNMSNDNIRTLIKIIESIKEYNCKYLNQSTASGVFEYSEIDDESLDYFLRFDDSELSI